VLAKHGFVQLDVYETSGVVSEKCPKIGSSNGAYLSNPRGLIPVRYRMVLQYGGDRRHISVTIHDEPNDYNVDFSKALEKISAYLHGLGRIEGALRTREEVVVLLR
jgi:hypothetical protein